MKGLTGVVCLDELPSRDDIAAYITNVHEPGPLETILERALARRHERFEGFYLSKRSYVIRKGATGLHYVRGPPYLRERGLWKYDRSTKARTSVNIGKYADVITRGPYTENIIISAPERHVEHFDALSNHALVGTGDLNIAPDTVLRIEADLPGDSESTYPLLRFIQRTNQRQTLAGWSTLLPSLIEEILTLRTQIYAPTTLGQPAIELERVEP